MVKITQDDIKKRYGESIFRQGNEYFEGSRVFNFEIKGNKATAYVAGSLDEPYEVELTLTTREWKTSCDCGSSLCKHEAAVLLKYIQEYENHKQVDPFAALDRAAKRVTRRRDRDIPLSDKVANDYLSDIIEMTFKPVPLIPDSGDRQFKLIFILYFRQQYLLKPAAAFLKRDNTLGRVEAYSDAKITEPMTEEENTILKNLLSENTALAKLLFYMDTIDTGQLTIYYENDRKEVKFRRCVSLVLDFRVDEIQDNNDIIFYPYLSLIGEEGEILGEGIQYSDVDIIRMCFCYYNTQTGIMAYNSEDNDIVGFVEFVVKTNQEYHFSDIEKLKKSIQPDMSGKISINFAYNKVSLQNSVPEIGITIKERGEILVVSLSFRYGSTEVNYVDNTEYLVDKKRSRGTELVIQERSHEYENLAYDLLANLFLDQGDDPFGDAARTAETGDVNFHFPYTPLEFLLKYGEGLMEKGISVKLEEKKLTRKDFSLSFAVLDGIDWFDIKTLVQTEEGPGFHLVIDPDLLKKGIMKIGESYTMISEEDIKLLLKLYDEGMDASGILRTSKLNFSIIDEVYKNAVNKQNEEVQRCVNIYEKLKDFKSIKQTPPPAAFKGTLRSYQQAGYNWMNFMHDYQLSGCLADDMGLGKTVQTLALLQGLKERGMLFTSLLIMPVVTLSNWEAEITQFTPSLTFTRHTGARRAKSIEELQAFDLILISYQTLRNDIDLFAGYEFCYIILDEAHYIKNAASQVFKAIRSLRSQNRLSLTGTPIENNTMELWAQMDFLNPGLLGNRRSFRSTFAKQIENDKDPGAAERLRKLVFPFIMRRKKEDVLKDLPEKEEIIFYTEMTEEQEALYKQVKEFYRQKLMNAMKELQPGEMPGQMSMDIFKYMLKLRQLAIFPELANKDYAGIPSTKFESLKDLIDEIIDEDHKVLIFSQFVEVLKIIEEWCRKKKFKYSFLSGSTGNRDGEIKKFREDPENKIFLLSLKAGGVGINLTEADYVIIFDPWWNPAAERQAIDRSHRMGQKKKVFAYKMIVKDTIEEKILKLQMRKRELVNELITEEESVFKALSGEDIISLFE